MPSDPNDRPLPSPAGAGRELTWLRRLHESSRTLAQTPDLAQLLVKILGSAVELTDAERGFLVRLRPHGSELPRIKVEVALGFDGGTLRGPEGKVSRTVLDRVLKEDRSVVTAHAADGMLVEVSSVRQQRVRSIACVPLRLRGEIIGVLYLDHRFVKEAFTESDLPCLESFCDQAALILETMELLGEQRSHERQLNQTLKEIDALKAPGLPDSLPRSHEIPRVGSLVGASQVMQDVYGSIEQAARGGSPVLIVGERGVGKRLVAREIHDRSPRRSAPFLVQPCAGMSEADLCGAGRGVLEDVLLPIPGAFQNAGGGTLYLPNIAELSLPLQARVMEVLRRNIVIPAGGSPLPTACRVIASSTKDPKTLVERGGLREDLFCLLDMNRIEVPPLSERTEDLPALLAHFLAGAEVSVSRLALDRLVDYAWPGNVRELENLASRLKTLGPGRIDVEDLSAEVRGIPVAFEGKTLEGVRRELVEAALRESNGSRTRAARSLGVARSTLYRLLERYDLA